MFTLFLREVNSFLNSLIGYVTMGLFLTAIGLFMWIFPGNFNVLESGYAHLDTLFIIAPWVFIFLCPAITMRSFSEEWKSGTIEMLFTKPIGDWGIILAKFLAGFALVIISLVPTLFYYYTIGELGAPEWNIDKGAIWGSYFGLVFLAGGFVAIGVFASSLTSSQIVAFILGVFLSFFVYIGFESIAGLGMFGGFDSVIQNLGINEHFISMSRGVIDTRDVLYFMGLVAAFLLLTKLILESRRW